MAVRFTFLENYRQLDNYFIPKVYIPFETHTKPIATSVFFPIQRTNK